MKRYRNTSKCITSKSGLISLVWSFAVGTIYGIAYQPSNFMIVLLRVTVLMPVFFVGSAIILCFYPLAGFLADNKIGRYKTIIRSLQILFGCFIIGIIITIPFVILSVAGDGALAGLVGITVFPVLIFFPMTTAFVGFNANLIQFGMDQLHDSPMDHQSLFIHWYVWVYYLAEFISRLPWQFVDISNLTVIVILPFIVVVMLLLGIVFLIVARRRSHWFLIDSARVTP